jgi:hypothetical protein
MDAYPRYMCPGEFYHGGNYCLPFSGLKTDQVFETDADYDHPLERWGAYAGAISKTDQHGPACKQNESGCG